jgi:hypothetical protein
MQRPGYGYLAISLHWLIVVLLVVQFVVAWSMPEIHRGVVPETLINLHMSFGVLMLPVVIFRLLGRLQLPVPLLRDNVGSWQQTAHVTHSLLYLCCSWCRYWAADCRLSSAQHSPEHSNRRPADAVDCKSRSEKRYLFDGAQAGRTWRNCSRQTG